MGSVVEPYYKITVPPVRLGYLKFRLAFVLFGYLNSLLHGNFALTLFVWDLIWWGLLCGLTLWLMHRFLPDASIEMMASGLGFLMLFSFGLLKPQLLARLHPLSIGSFQELQLPYIRPFFPQIPIVLLVLYLLSQMEVMRKQASWLWAAMGVLQLIAFMVFPYTIVMMAGITAIAALGQLFSKLTRVPWGALLLYGAGCGASDLIFFLHGHAVLRAGSPEQQSLIHIQLSVLPHLIGGMWIVLALLTALVLLNRTLLPEVKWPLVGLGVSNLLFLIGDAFFAVTSLQMSHHAGYFVQLTTALLFIFLAAAVYKHLSLRLPLIRFVGALILSFLLINGALLARATYVIFLPMNQERADFARLLKSRPPKSIDLVIARSQFADDPATWIPLLTDAEALFCSNAQFLLLPDQNRNLNRFRQALYLYFTGKDSEWLEQVLNNPKEIGNLLHLALAAQVTPFEGEERKKSIGVIRGEIAPLFARVESHDSESYAFFNKYRTILVVDNIKNKNFVISRLATYLRVEKEEKFGELLVLTCTPQPSIDFTKTRSETK
jgi:hypothetical protein